MNTLELEFRLYRSKGVLSGLIGFRSNGGEGEYTHVDVVDPETGWLWGAHADSFIRKADLPAAYKLTVTPTGVLIPAGYYPRPPGYDAANWLSVTSCKLKIGQGQSERFWASSWKKWGAPYDKRGLIDTYVLGRNWRQPGAWYCSEAQASNCEDGAIIRPMLADEAVEPADFAEVIYQRGAHLQDVA